MRRASAAVRSAMKVVAVVSVTVRGRRAGRCCLRAWDSWGRMSYRTSSGGRVRAAVVAPGLDLGLGLATGCGRGLLTGWVAVWRRSWVSAGSRVWASSGRGPWRRRGCSLWGLVLGPVYEVSSAAWGVEC